MSDDLPRRPFDHHVEPLFAGLGVREPAPSPRRRGALVRGALLVLGAAALLLWWLA